MLSRLPSRRSPQTLRPPDGGLFIWPLSRLALWRLGFRLAVCLLRNRIFLSWCWYLTATDAVMTEYNPSSTTQPAASSAAIESLNGTEHQLDLDKKTPSRKKKAAPRRPAQTIESAITTGVPPKRLDELVKSWSKYNTHQALIKAKDEAKALAEAVAERRRTIAEALLACADQHGITITEARKMLEAIESSRSGKSK